MNERGTPRPENRVPTRIEGQSMYELRRYRDEQVEVIARSQAAIADATQRIRDCDALLEQWGEPVEPVDATLSLVESRKTA